MARALGIAGAQKLLAAKAHDHLQKRADQLRDITVQLHREAPRGGSYLNRYGQNRSAAGEVPAPEEGNLMRALEMPPTPIPGGFAVPVNRYFSASGKSLEFGTATIAARPMGRMAVALLKAEVDGG